MTWLPKVQRLVDEARATVPDRPAALLAQLSRLGRRSPAERLLARAFEGGWTSAVLAAHHDVRRDAAERLDAELSALEERYPHDPDKVMSSQLEAVSRSLRDQDRIFRTARELLMADAAQRQAGGQELPEEL